MQHWRTTFHWIGQTGLTGKNGPVRYPVKRRRIRTVMQELMYLASRLVESGRRLKLSFSYNCPCVRIFKELCQRPAYGQILARLLTLI